MEHVETKAPTLSCYTIRSLKKKVPVDLHFNLVKVSEVKFPLNTYFH